MTYPGCVRISYGNRPTRLERLRMIDAENEELRRCCDHSQTLWGQSSKSLDERRDACTTVATVISGFAMKVGMSSYAVQRVNDLLIALNELQCGRKSVLLAPAPVHSGKLSVTDRMQQGMAQACVDILRGAGFSAGEARKRTAGLFEKHKLPKFGESKLRAVGSRLTGRGATQEPGYDLYQWASNHAANLKTQYGLTDLSQGQALKLADVLVGLTKLRDHRHDFFFASREDSSLTL